MKNKKKIIFIFHDLSLTGAPIIFNKYLNQAKSELNFDIKTVTRYKYGQHLIIDNVITLHKKLPNFLIHSLFHKIFDLFYFILYFIKNRPHLVITNTFINTTPILIAKILNIKTITLIHENKGAKINFIKLRALILKHSDKIIAVSTATEDFCLSHNIHNEKIFLIRNGLDLTNFKCKNEILKKEVYTLGAMANWSQFKRLDLVIKFYNEIKKNKKYKFHLIIGGDSYHSFSNQFNKYIQENDDVEFCGLITNNKHFYEKIDGYLFFSENESYPTVLMECLYFQVPVFSLDNINSAKEVLSSALISDSSIEDLAKKCINFYHLNRELNFKEWHKNANEILYNIDIQKSWNKFYNLIVNK